MNVWVDEDYACTQFQSCSKVSLIASASIQSSMSFLDFLSVNGENQSLTVFKEKEQALSQQRDQFQSLLQSQLADREKRFQQERMQFVQNEGEERRKEVEKVRAAYEAKLRELVAQHDA